MVDAKEMKKILRANGYNFIRCKGSHFYVFKWEEQNSGKQGFELYGSTKVDKTI